MESGLNMTLPAGLIPAFPMLFRKGENPMKKRICCFTFLILLSLFFFALPETKADAPAPASGKDQQNILYSGVGEDGLSWQLTGDGTLTISGSGQMYPYDPVHEAYCGYDQRPWHSCRALIHTAVVEEGVTNVGEYAFYDCPNLTQIILADSVTRIGYMAFGDCTGLTNVTIGENVADAGSCSYGSAAGVFHGCTNLQSITVEEENEYYRSLNGVLFSEDMTELCEYPAGKTDPSYSVPDGVLTIGAYAFMGCAQLKAVVLPDGMEFIGCCAFENCSHLGYLVIPVSLYGIDTLAFFGCTALTDVYYQGTPEQWNGIVIEDVYLSSGIRLASDPQADVPEWVLPVTPVDLHFGILAHGSCGANHGDNVTWTLFQDGLLSITGTGSMDWGFDDCPWTAWRDDVITAEIGSGVTNLPLWVFSKCTNLVSAVIPNGVTYIPEGAFEGCTSLTDVSLPEGLLSIGNGIFMECTSLSSISLPDSVTYIGTGAFAYCYSLTSVTVPAGLSYDPLVIYADIFNSALALREILVAPGNSCFASVDGVLFDKDMKKLYAYPRGKTDSIYEIPDGVTSIETSVFEENTHINTLIIPRSLELIDVWAFSRTNISDIIYHGTAGDWQKITIRDYNYSLDNIAIQYRPVADLVLPASLTVIQSQAFLGIPEGTIVFIPDNVTDIAETAFEEGTIIVAPAGSYAAQWADAHGFEWYPQ